MSTNLECGERDRKRKEKVGDRLAELKEKKSDRKLKNKRDEFRWKNNMIYRRRENKKCERTKGKNEGQ